MPRYAWTTADLAGARLVWILDLSWAGQVIRVATEPIAVSSEDGVLQYTGGLGEVTVREGFDLFEDTAQGSESSLEVLLPINVPALVAQGYDLATAAGELSQLRVGDTWENRRVVLSGRVVDPDHGRAEEPVRFTLRATLWEDTAQIPDATAVVTEGSWYSATYGGQQTARLSESDVGQVYPIIIGRPGYAPQQVDGWVSGSRAVWANKGLLRHALIIAGHPVEATSVWVNMDDRPDGNSFTVSTTTDSRGRIVSVISDSSVASGADPRGPYSGLEESAAPDAFAPAVANTAPFFVGWRDGGGLIGSDGRAIRGAGTVLEWALEQTTMPVDLWRVREITPALNKFLIDTAIEDFTSPMEWIRAHLLPILPISLAAGPNGVYPILWRYDATAADAVLTIDADADPRIEVGRVSSDSQQIRNTFSLRYQWAARPEVYTAIAKIGPDYISEPGYARGRLYKRENTGAYLDLRATSAGAAGAITWTLTAGAGPNTVDGVGSVALEHLSGTTLLSDLATDINSTSALITAELVGTDATVGGSSYATSGSLVWEDASTRADYYCAASVSRLRTPTDSGVRPEALESVVVYDEPTAFAILGWRARAFAFAQRTVPIVMPESVGGILDRGSVVVVNDTSQGITSAVAIVTEVERGSDGLIGLRCRIIEDPLRDPRS